MHYLSVCSGIEAATVAWHPLGWSAAGFSEIDRFPSSVLAHHYPHTSNFGDMNEFRRWPDADVDVLVGGTPCQSFSVAGLRQGLADPRGNLALVYLAIAERYRPEWLVWENVPGVLSADGGRAFGAIIGAMVKLGYGVAWRVLDAQYFGVPQRRRRVFIVGYIGDWRTAAAVLFEPESLRRNPPPGRGARQNIAGTITGGASLGGMGPAGRGHEVENSLIPEVANPLTHRMHKGINTTADEGQTPIITHALDSYSAGRATEDGTGRGCPLIAAPLTAGSNPNSNAAGRRREDDINLIAAFDETPVTSAENRSNCNPDTSALAAAARPPAVALSLRGREGGNLPEIEADDVSPAIRTGGGGSGNPMVLQYAVRRLTPLECERLQGFPDGYTDIPGASDSARYKALGNSMAVPVMRWLGQRIVRHRSQINGPLGLTSGPMGR